MVKEQKLAFEYGQAASVSVCSFAESYDSYMCKLVGEARSKADHRRNKENMQAWYRGYIFQSALAGNGISQEMFSTGLNTLIDSNPESIPNWIEFAIECVNLGQYVDFIEEKNPAVAVNRWLETLLSGLLETQRQYGTHIGKQVCDLALLPNCLYPSEMLQAAAHFQSGGVSEEISKMIESGAIEGNEPFFPKLVDKEGENNSQSPNEVTDQAEGDTPTLCQY